MINLVDLIMSYYPWIILVSIIILLAVIGYYADKTNFGQGKEKENTFFNDEDLNTLEVKDEADFKDSKEEEQKQKKDTGKEKKDVDNTDPLEWNNNVNINTKEEPLDEFDKFSKEFDEILPEKELIDDDLLSDIDDLSLDKTQKISLKDIPDLDDIELPKIKPLKSSKTKKDVWKKN